MYPILEICSPEGEQTRRELTQDRITIGRYAQMNDIGLEPDPQNYVTRKAHCILERGSDAWWLIDKRGVNKTFVVRNGQPEMVVERQQLLDGDTIRILGRVLENGDTLYWELTFRDPLQTQRGPHNPLYICLDYDWKQARLFRLMEGRREEIEGLRPQEHKLIRYMDECNRQNGGGAVLCSYDDLIRALWGDEVNHTQAEINHLVYETRKTIEADPKQPRFLQTVPGLGYRFEPRPRME